ncbi:hypothetical protein ACHAAC_06490 [Aeromicrobium sp. CF4.19]|uniref:hypothetical protein n=1 Tax=Aeromicrobium sp. CF4.19 TaxID=3373082 RepID=UPI003EE48D48
MVDRVPWVRYDGDDIEAVVAMMLNRENPRSVRIAPSQGDGGVDILERGGASDGGDVVWQVKRFAERDKLTSADKAKIAASLKKLLDPDKRDPRWERLNVTEWHLVMPLDSTPEDVTWLEDQAADCGVKVIWDGLAVVDQLAAKYGDVIDYYLHGGKSAIEEAYREAMALMSLGSATADSELTVAEVTARIEKALGTLDRDPHYMFEVRFGHGEPPQPTDRPGLVMTWFRIDESKQTWQAVDVMARCAASIDERPITIKGALDVSGDPDFAMAVQEFFEFGTPFTSPAGTYTGEIDAPGGLGGELEEATIRTTPTANPDLGADTELTFEVLGPEADVLARADVDRTDQSSGTAGLRTVLSEVDGVFEIVAMLNLKDQTMGLTLTLKDIEGLPVARALPAVEFLAAFCHPNTYRLFPRHVPAHLGVNETIPTGNDELTRRMLGLAHRLRPLDTLQQHTRSTIRVPDLEAIAGHYREWAFVAKIVNGDDVAVTANEGDEFHVVLPETTTLPDVTFRVALPLRTRVGDQLLEFGTVLGEFVDPEILSKSDPKDGQIVYAVRTPDRSMRYIPDTEDVEPPESTSEA